VAPVTAEGGTIVVVLGYSERRSDGLHPICAARVQAAAGLANGARTVVFSGSSRRPGRAAEAELMRRAWTDCPTEVVCDEEARVTAETAAYVAALAQSLGAREVVAVTSWWHRPRTALLFRSVLPGVRVEVVGVRTPWSARLLLRELGAFPLVPLQLALARSRRRSLAAAD
jgi:uncharacterized SAM-binding protein YcdF (DUF218 family)